MTIIGLDVSKREIIGVRINKRAQVKEKFKVENNPGEINNFLDKISIKHRRMTLGSEATSEYHNTLAKSCLKKNIPFYVLNPIVTKRFTQATVRKKKTDLTDAQVIAQCVLQGEGSLVSQASFDPLKFKLRAAVQLARSAVKFSHMNKRFVDHFPQTVLVQKELKKLKEATLASMKKIQQEALEQTDITLTTLLETIPGIGKVLSPIFIAEIGDINNFKNHKSLIAFSGLDPRIKQSGLALKHNTRLTKRGSPYLRRAAFLAASIAQRHDQEFKEYFEKKMNEGKRYREATVANARHILSRIYAVWKRKTPYRVSNPQKKS
jgi:transposase